MSATNRGAQRIEADNYPTPPWVLRALFRRLAAGRHSPAVLFEPFAGDARVLRIGREYFPQAFGAGIELRDVSAPQTTQLYVASGVDAFDILRTTPLSQVLGDMCVTNPPFSRALEAVQEVVPRVGGMSWFLLRGGFLDSETRAEWHRNNKPCMEYRLWRRPDFVATCKGRSKTQTRSKLPGCGALYPRGTTGACGCGGAIGAGTDASSYSWFGYDRLGRTGPWETDFLDLDGLDFSEN